jgi:signal transduction histidine kinase/AmiR/NasT family two-component response regulator
VSAAVDPLESLIRARILIVEDEGIVAKDLQISLRSLGYTVCGVAVSGPEAVAKAESLRPDLLLMDIRLRGEMDGIEAARRIRARMDAPIVFLTAYADADTLRRAASIGPYAYVLKPFDERELQVTIIMAMCKHRAFAELDRRVQERTEALLRTETRYRRLEAVASLGLFALRTPDLDAVMQRAVEVVSESLGTELAQVLERMPDGKALVMRAGVGWPDGLVGRATAGADHASQAGFTLLSSEPVVVADLRSETRFREPALLKDHGVISGVSVVIHAPGPGDGHFGVLAAHSRAGGRFSSDDANFLQAVANVIATAILRAAADATIRAAEGIVQAERVRATMAEEALRARDEFLSVAAHELRTPVAALQLQLETMRELLAPHAASLDRRIRERADRAVGSIGRLASLIDGVLDVSRMALGSLVLEREPFDLGEAVREVVARHEDLAKRAGCILRFSAAGVLRGAWDRTRVEQVVTNLLSNAIKFAPGHPIDIRVEAARDAARLTVRDHGPGIDPADAERILRRFERAVSHCHHGGLGLGLYIAGQIAREHGGDIEVSSRPGAGATFLVTLPFAPPSARPRGACGAAPGGSSGDTGQEAPREDRSRPGAAHTREKKPTQG